jgi:hypothetical protein
MFKQFPLTLQLQTCDPGGAEHRGAMLDEITVSTPEKLIPHYQGIPVWNIDI